MLFGIFLNLFHLDETLNIFIASYGIWAYVALFMIIFCETGLVITPFLPGDSLLFAAGSVAAASNNATLDIRMLFVLLVVASILGNKVNYLIGRRLGQKIFTEKNRFFNKKHLQRTHEFYQRQGGKTIILARFIPIIRTFAPFIAGASSMNLRQFTFYNLFSAIVWVGSLLACGYFLGSLSLIKQHFNFFLYLIILLSILLPFTAYQLKKIRLKRERN